MHKIKRKLAALLIVAMSININSFGAIVSDNDGSAFVTKAEFDALKSSFYKQIDDYNSSIDGKIDGAIASYLAGIQISNNEIVQTGFSLDGINNSVKFLGRTTNVKNLNNEPYTKDVLFAFIAKTYEAIYLAGDETYHYIGWDATKTNGSTSNFLIYRDTDGICQDAYYNYNATYTRNLIGYSDNYALFGGAFLEATASLTFPSNFDTESSADTFTGVSWGFANRNKNGPYTKYLVLNFYRFGDATNRAATPSSASASKLNGSIYDTTRNTSLGGHTMRFADQSAVCTWRYITKTGNYSFQGTKETSTLHWPRGTTTGMIKCLAYPFGSYENMQPLTTTQEPYSVTRRLSLCSGIMCDAWAVFKEKKLGKPGGVHIMPGTIGYGLKFKYTEYSPEQIIYKNSALQWTQKNKMGNGFLMYFSDMNNGKLKLSLKSDTAGTILRFKNSTYQATDDTSDTNLLTFKYKTSSSTETEAKKLVMAMNTVYEITIDYKKNDKLYVFPIPADDATVVTVSQVGDAILIKD